VPVLAGRCRQAGVGYAGPRLQALDDGARGQSATAAHGHEGQVGVATLELVQSRRDQAASGGTHRVTDGDGPAVDVHLVGVGSVDLGHEQTTEAKASLTSKMSMSLIVMPAFGQNLGGGSDRPVEVVVGVGADENLSHDPRPGPQALRLGRSSDIQSTAAAPSEICDEFPAVCIPSEGRA